MLVIRSWSLRLALGLTLTLPGLIGCTPPPPETKPPATAATTLSDAELQREVDEVLDSTLNRRLLNTAEHGAWQILHGVLAYQRVFPVRVGTDGPIRPALDYAVQGGQIRGWTFQPGEVLDPSTGRRGLRAIVEPGTKKGQGHADQWLAILAQSGLSRDDELKIDGQTFTMDQFIQQVQRDVPYNAEREWSWSLIGLTRYLPTDAQ